MRFKLSFLSLMNIYILIFFFVLRKSLAVDENFTVCSEPSTCGRHNIKFPFFIQERRCGYPAFNISCRNSTDPILSLPDGDYIIHDIFYQNQSFQVSKAVAFDRDAVCSHSIPNISIPEDWLSLAPNQAEIFLLFNCNLTVPSTWELSQHKVNCSAENETNATLALFNNDPKLNFASKYCNKTVLAPVAFYEGEQGVESMLNRGFVLKWIASDCSICEASGGKCGFDYSTYHFKCFCPDRPHAWHCTPASSIAGIVVLIILAFCFIKKFSSEDSMFNRKTKTEADKKIEAFLKDNVFLAPKRYRHSDIKKITNSFQYKLGQGGYGDVYRGKLLDGRHVAVKILKKSQRNGEEFMNEVASISRTSHVNVVTLLGFCFEGRRRALIYEFVPNGSLEKFIFQEKAGHRQLEWETLYQIAVGIARGLQYLHRGCKTRILHFDIKPHNILLDADFCPKISDFGLAKLCPEKESAISMTGARGTAGYIAPEVFSRNFGRVSHKSDVYSYGMMILETVGGRKNINVEVDRTSEIYFPHWIHDRIELDEELGLQGIIDGDDQERVRKMIIVSLWCIQTDPSNRPPMSRVVEMMEGNIDSLNIPPKPFLSSPPTSPDANSTSRLIA
ncbi:PREDICTED: LEAF RUST 10 DISEASE-RESISTANCE LOCUS RECEPTOR-LIKE PROTEIN KINASE-like 2.1 isoform X2 [Theobroma cacao]|uniref:non-specific serine/threonine protein kinase n=1 Tax=Theobroma cacao TaxID=3641 RepID=A0AB32VZG9_THECC|nr:PREDICTED: LEAF RUST 10 DISEASE-RESISTANCE LOCUS RECEPTOR-LIKE PROTEIN KINASE-like 2.1 isoform X2 [Theobroma cacao]